MLGIAVEYFIAISANKAKNRLLYVRKTSNNYIFLKGEIGPNNPPITILPKNSNKRTDKLVEIL